MHDGADDVDEESGWGGQLEVGRGVDAAGAAGGAADGA